MKLQLLSKTVILLLSLITFISSAHIPKIQDRSSTDTPSSNEGAGLLAHVNDEMMDALSSILDGAASASEEKSSEELKIKSSSEEIKKTSSSEDNPTIAKADNNTSNSFNINRNFSASNNILPRIPIFPGSMFLSPSMASRLTSNMQKNKRMNTNSRNLFPGMARNMAGAFPQQSRFPFMQRPIPPMLQLGAGRLMAQDFLHRPGMESFLPIIGNSMSRPGSPLGLTGSSGFSGFDGSGIPNTSSFSSSFGSNPLLDSQFRQGLATSNFGAGMSGLSGGFGGLSSGTSSSGGFGGLNGGFGGLNGGMSGFGSGIGGLGNGMSGLGGGLGGLGGGLGGLGGGLGGLGGGLGGLGGGIGGLGGGMSGLGMNPLFGLSSMSGLGLQNPALRLSGGSNGMDFTGDSQSSSFSNGFGMGSSFNHDDFNLAQRPLSLAKNSSLPLFGSANAFGANPMLDVNKFGLNGVGIGGMPMVNPLLLHQARLLGLNQQMNPLLSQAQTNPLLLQSLMAGGGLGSNGGLTPMIQPGGMVSLQPQNSFFDLTNMRNTNSLDNLFRPNRTFDVLSGGIFSGSNPDVTKLELEFKSTTTTELPDKARIIIEPVSQLSSPDLITEVLTTTLSSKK